jgi:hypothetical protein
VPSAELEALRRNAMLCDAISQVRNWGDESKIVGNKPVKSINHQLMSHINLRNLFGRPHVFHKFCLFYSGKKGDRREFMPALFTP